MHSNPFHLFNPASCGVLEMGLEISHKQARHSFSPLLENLWVKSASTSHAKNTAERVFHCWSSTWKGFLKVTDWDWEFLPLRFTLSSCTALLCVIWLCSSLPLVYSDKWQLQGQRCQRVQLTHALSNCSWSMRYHHTTPGQQACDGGIALATGSLDEKPFSWVRLSGVALPQPSSVSHVILCSGFVPRSPSRWPVQKYVWHQKALDLGQRNIKMSHTLADPSLVLTEEFPLSTFSSQEQLPRGTRRLGSEVIHILFAH